MSKKKKKLNEAVVNKGNTEEKGGDMDIDNLKEYIKFMEDNDLCELEIEEKGKRIRLKKNSSNVYKAVPEKLSSITEEKKEEEKKEEEKNENITEIKSPMVGTFYSAPSPGAKPYVEIGKIIKPGDVVCIVEAMKLMNEIKAEVAGKIIKKGVENGQPVEFGQTLFTLEIV